MFILTMKIICGSSFFLIDSGISRAFARLLLAPQSDLRYQLHLLFRFLLATLVKVLARGREIRV